MSRIPSQTSAVSKQRVQSILKVLILSLLSNLTLSIVKLVFAKKTGMLTFFADGIHSLFDTLATGLGMVSVSLSAHPPDEGHPYGHRKFETIGALVLAFLLLLTTYEIAQMIYEKIKNPSELPSFSLYGVVILAAAMIVNYLVSRVELKKGSQLKSSFLIADSLHNRTDFLVAFCVLLSLISVELKLKYVDTFFALLIAIYLGYFAIALILSNLQPLVDSRVLDPHHVIQVAESVPDVLHAHRVRSRGISDHYFLDLNLHLRGDISLERAHEITHQVEHKLKETFPGLTDVVIHTEPHGHHPCPIDASDVDKIS